MIIYMLLTTIIIIIPQPDIIPCYHPPLMIIGISRDSLMKWIIIIIIPLFNNHRYYKYMYITTIEWKSTIVSSTIYYIYSHL